MLSTARALATAGAVTVAVVGFTVPAAAAGGPAVTGLSPTYGPLGSTLDIQGSGFTGDPTTTTVTIGSSQPTPASAVSPTDITVTVPDDATTGTVTVYEGLTPVSGPRFTVQHPATATLAVSRRVTTYPATVLVTGTLRDATTHHAASGHRARLQKKFRGSSRWARVAHTKVRTTGHRGRVAWQVTPGQNLSYRVVFAATPHQLGATTGRRAVGVRPRLTVSLPATTRTRTQNAISGRVQPRVGGRLTVQRLRHGRWHTVARPAAHHGRFATPVSWAAAGTYRYRVLRAHGTAYRSATSRTVVTRVVNRDLQLGDSGSDVRALQRRLRHLHYDVGPVSSSFGYDLLHAVTAFEKVNRLPKDGVAGSGVFARLAHPRRPHLRHPIRGATAVEVNLSRQILLIAKNGHVWRILDTSTAGGYYYTDSQGQQEKAVTPTGHFAIRYKENGTVHARLGTLYRPSYFNDSGYAIHGEGNGNDGGEVPPYPNSHGCVRITDLAVDRYYDLFAVGMSVWIYQ